MCARCWCALSSKGIAYEVDHIVPFFGDDRFSKLSPLRRIPVLVDGDLVLSDSSVICQYIEDKQPAPALLPADIRDRARARWLEEFADTRMGDVFIWRLFNQIAIRPVGVGREGRSRTGRSHLEGGCAGGARLSRGRSSHRRFSLRGPVARRHRHRRLLPQCRLGALPDRCSTLAARRRLRLAPHRRPRRPRSSSWPGSRTPYCARRSPSSAMRSGN